MIRAGDLQRAKLVDQNGRRIGHVDELQIKDGRLSAVAYGVGGALQRFWPRRGGGRIAWDQVMRFEAGRLVVSLEKGGAGKSSKGTDGTSTFRQ